MKRQHSHADRGADRYETPPCAVRALLNAMPDFDGYHPNRLSPVWEPACATGNISKTLEEYGYTVISSDLYPPSYGYCEVDFLDRSVSFVASSVITNPPYRLANDFVRRALEVAPHVYMLLKTTFLEGDKRSDIIERSGLRRVFQFRNRIPMMHRDGWTGPKITNPVAYAWFEWEAGYTGYPEIVRITCPKGD
jgi:predicted RNA methylase